MTKIMGNSHLNDLPLKTYKVSEKEAFSNLEKIDQLFELADREVVPFDWMHWRTLHIYLKNPSIIQNLSRESLLKIAMAHIRMERFCVGVINRAIEDGSLLKIAERIELLS